MNTFSSLGLSQSILDVIQKQGYETPTPIQARSIPPVLAGRDLLGCAQTGTGKTAAFALPMLDLLHASTHGMSKAERRIPRALVLSPTRELAGQIEDSMRTYGRHTRLRHVVIYGGVNQHRQVRQLQAGVDVIVATPGRLLDLLDQGYIDLSEIDLFVLDEADRMLDMGFINPIRTIAGMLPSDRQTLMFSATMPANIKKLAATLLTEPECVAVTPDKTAAPLIEQSVYMVSRPDKPALLSHFLKDEDVERAVVFTRTKHGADKLAKRLYQDGIHAGAIHGNKSQNQRTRVLDAFRSGRCRVLIATDVAARGLDVDGVSHVFNFTLPDEPESYVHRIGRTGRAGSTGLAITLCSREERGNLRTVERIIGSKIDVQTIPSSANIDSERQPPRANSGDNDNQATVRPAAKPSSKPNGKPNGKRKSKRPARNGPAAGSPNGGPRGSSGNGPSRGKKQSKRKPASRSARAQSSA